jgi:ubiquinone/menaquinone biosynthesis C-methylase UbiE
MWLVLSGLGALALLLVWELWICEGAHLGPRFVVWLYDLAAIRYDRIKAFDQDWERRFLGEPIAAALATLPDVRILDVGAGTGRLARALLPEPSFHGRITCLEPSRRMLARGRSIVPGMRVEWLRAWADPLPIDNAAFDVVVSLEILEFTPQPEMTLREMVRVLRPGGWLVLTNRIGWEAPLIVGRTFPRKVFIEKLEAAGLQDISVYPWQMDYDLAWARKRFI